MSGTIPESAQQLRSRAGISTAPRAGVPGFLVHDLQDAVIPYAEAEALANAWPGLKFMSTSGKGHRDILSAPEVMKAIVDFVVPAAPAAR